MHCRSIRAASVRNRRVGVASDCVMGLHKLSAGDGYTYLTRQVAVHDATDRGHTGLGDYYSEKGESPGRWWGAGLSALEVEVGSEVTEQQMRNLFGEGRHPDAERLEDGALDAGASVAAAKKAFQLGSGVRGLCRQCAGVLAGDGAPVHRLQLRARRALEDACPGAGAGPDPHRAGHRACSPASTAGPRWMSASCAGFLARAIPAADVGGRRLRPDLHPGQVGLDAVGGSRPGDRRTGRGRPRRRRRADVGVAGTERVVTPAAAAAGSSRSRRPG